MTATARELAAFLDDLLQTRVVPDYAHALNGLQFEHHGPVRRIAAAVDFSLRTVQQAVARDADFMIVHHGMYWGGVRPLVGPLHTRVEALVRHDVAVYASHLPLDAHPKFGNAALLANALGLTPAFPFGHHHGVAVGTGGEDDLATGEIRARAEHFARDHGGTVRVSECSDTRRTRRWAICTGAGASAEILRETYELNIDTLIVGEGPHHSAVDAPESGLVIVYAGHYATETLGVQAIAEHTARRFTLPWEFIPAPTGL
jgi:dinuclear metal center YbgI/SA1388 family protein